MRTSISTLLQLGLVLLLLLCTNGTFGQPLRKSDLKARKLHTVREDQAIVQQYILRFKDDVTMSDSELDQRSNELATMIGATIVWVYKSAIKGFTFLLNDANTDLDTILAEDDVEGIEQDSLVEIDAMELVSEAETDSLDDYVVPIGLDRIDQLSLPLNGQYTFRYTGSKVTIYLIDTGTATSHTEFGTRAKCGFDATSPQLNCYDAFNHGTHVAATIGGSSVGVAKLVNIVSVKVIANDGGTMSAMLAGIDYVMQQKKANPSQPMVANMSVGGVFSPTVNKAVDQLVAAGVTVVAAAGNKNIDACLVSPSAASGAITVASSTITEYATNNKDRRALYSNWGVCVDIFALGTKINSASTKSSTSYRILSGTSMAAPHVTGVVAMYLQRNPKLTPAEIKSMLLADANKGKLMSLYQSFSPNKLLYIGKLT